MIKCSKISICVNVLEVFSTIYWQHCFVSETTLPMCLYLSISPCPLHLPETRIFQSPSQLLYDSNHRLSITCETKSKHITSKSVIKLTLSSTVVLLCCYFHMPFKAPKNCDLIRPVYYWHTQIIWEICTLGGI